MEACVTTHRIQTKSTCTIHPFQLVQFSYSRGKRKPGPRDNACAMQTHSCVVSARVADPSVRPGSPDPHGPAAPECIGSAGSAEGIAGARAATARSALSLRVTTTKHTIAIAVTAPAARPAATRVRIGRITTPKDICVTLRLCRHFQRVHRHTVSAAQPSNRAVPPLLSPRLSVSANARTRHSDRHSSCRTCPLKRCCPRLCTCQWFQRCQRPCRRTSDRGAPAPCAGIGISGTSYRALDHATSVGVGSTPSHALARRKPGAAHALRACTFPSRGRHSHNWTPSLLAALVGVGRAALGEASFASCSGRRTADSTADSVGATAAAAATIAAAAAAAASSRGAAVC